MLVDEEPGIAAFFPNSGVSHGRINELSVFHFDRDVHRDCGPGDVAVARYFEFFGGSERSGHGAVEQILAHPCVIFLPTRIGKRSEIIEDEAVAFVVKLGGVFRITGTPGGAIGVD
jgi:hypothetical protein